MVVSVFQSLDFACPMCMLRNGWGGVGGMLAFLKLAHMLDATQWMGWGVQRSLNLHTCNVGCYAMDWVGWVGC